MTDDFDRNLDTQRRRLDAMDTAVANLGTVILDILQVHFIFDPSILIVSENGMINKTTFPE